MNIRTDSPIISCRMLLLLQLNHPSLGLKSTVCPMYTMCPNRCIPFTISQTPSSIHLFRIDVSTQNLKTFHLFLVL